MDGEPMQPGVEPVRVAKPGQVPPSLDQRLLDRVARELRVPEDESGRRVQPRERRVDELGEGVMIALPRPFHECSLVHGHLGVPRPGWSRSTAYGVGQAENCSFSLAGDPGTIVCWRFVRHSQRAPFCRRIAETHAGKRGDRRPRRAASTPCISGAQRSSGTGLGRGRWLRGSNRDARPFTVARRTLRARRRPAHRRGRRRADRVRWNAAASPAAAVRTRRERPDLLRR